MTASEASLRLARVLEGEDEEEEASGFLSFFSFSFTLSLSSVSFALIGKSSTLSQKLCRGGVPERETITTQTEEEQAE